MPAAAPARKLTFAGSVFAYFRLWRYQAHATVACFLSMYAGWIALAGGFQQLHAATIGLAMASATCILLATFLINDVADRDIDRIVHPERPIPRGLAEWKHIGAFGAILLVGGVALAWLAHLRFALAITLLAVAVASYYGGLKRRLPFPFFSDTIAPLISTLFPISAFLVVSEFPLDLLMTVVAFIYCADLAHDLSGGVHDRDGDRQHNVRTVAVAIGNRPTLWLSLAAFLLSLAAGGLVYVWGGLGWVYLATLGVLGTAMLYHYARALRVDAKEIGHAAGRTNHLGGFYFFIVSGSILPDYAIHRLLG